MFNNQLTVCVVAPIKDEPGHYQPKNTLALAFASFLISDYLDAKHLEVLRDSGVSVLYVQPEVEDYD